MQIEGCRILCSCQKKGDTWFVGATTNWNSREMTIDLSFFQEGNYKAEIFEDGINADKDTTDYKRNIKTVKTGDKLLIQLFSGGGRAARIEKEN